VLDLTGVGEIDDRCVELIRRAILRRQADDVTIAVAIGDPEIRESLEAFGLELIVPLIDGLRDARRSAGGLIAA
jgi:hypothetical protein